MTDTKFLTEWSKQLNVEIATLEKELMQAIAEMKNYFPTQSDDIILEKAKLKIKTNHKRSMMSSQMPFIGIILGMGEQRDMFASTREKQLAKYIDAKEKAEKTGDKSILNKVFTDGEIRINEKTGEIIPLWPKYKKDNTPNKLAGKDIKSPEECQTRIVFGVAKIFNKEKEQEIKPFYLNLQGKFVNDLKIEIGKIVSFKATIKNKDDKSKYILSSFGTTFVSAKDEEMQTVIDKMGIVKIVEHFFADKIVDWKTINEWLKVKNGDPNNNPLPDKFIGYEEDKFMIVKDCMCIYQNFAEDDNNRIKMAVCSTEETSEDLSMMCLMSKDLDEGIDFIQDSKIMVIGRIWFSAPKEGQTDFSPMMMANGAFAYPDWKIPRSPKAEKIKIENINQSPEEKSSDDNDFDYEEEE